MNSIFYLLNPKFRRLGNPLVGGGVYPSMPGGVSAQRGCLPMAGWSAQGVYTTHPSPRTRGGHPPRWPLKRAVRDLDSRSRYASHSFPISTLDLVLWPLSSQMNFLGELMPSLRPCMFRQCTHVSLDSHMTWQQIRDSSPCRTVITIRSPGSCTIYPVDDYSGKRLAQQFTI